MIKRRFARVIKTESKRRSSASSTSEVSGPHQTSTRSAQIHAYLGNPDTRSHGAPCTRWAICT